jgi:hypothetical protein
MAQVPGLVHDRHAAMADLALDGVPGANRCLDAVAQLEHWTGPEGDEG